MRTPIGKLMPEMAKNSGRTYSSTFCCRAKGLSSADAGMFFVINCRCVVKVVSDMRMMRMTVTMRVAVLGAYWSLGAGWFRLPSERQPG